MTSEWLKVMLEEIARKKSEAEQAQTEEDRRQGGDVVESAQRSRRENNGDSE